MLKPPAVRSGALLGILAPASPVRREFVEAGCAELERLGFRVRLGSHLYERGRYTAGSARSRMADWNELWDDPKVEAIFCARGGYGSMEMLAELSADRMREHPKAVLGSSDVTALLSFLLSETGIVCFHGPMVAQQIARGSYDASNLLEVLGETGAPRPFEVPALEVLQEGSAEGVLLGGCLSILAALVGTPYLTPFRDAILFLEDTGTKPYQIDRMLTQLRLAGLLDGVRGIVFGEMPGCEQHPEQGYRLQEMLRDWTSGLGVPVSFGFPSGHTRAPALTLPFGVRARLDARGLVLLEGAVR